MVEDGSRERDVPEVAASGVSGTGSGEESAADSPHAAARMASRGRKWRGERRGMVRIIAREGAEDEGSRVTPDSAGESEDRGRGW